MSNTSNLMLPFLAVGQAQKHVTVNETLRRLDAVVQLSVVSATTAVQPSSPADGSVYIVPAGKSGADWSAYANWSLGYYRDGAWEQVSPREGWLAFVKDADELLHYTGSGWSLFAPGKLVTLAASDRVLGRATSGAGAVEEIAFTDQARQLCDDASFAAMCATLGTWRVLAASAVAVSHTGDTNETALATVAIPAGAMGPNGSLRITAVFSHTNSANSKTLRIRLGGISGAAFMSYSNSANASQMTQRIIQNRNSQALQVSGAAGIANAVGAEHGIAGDRRGRHVSAQDLVISGQLASADEVITLESYLVELAYGAWRLPDAAREAVGKILAEGRRVILVRRQGAGRQGLCLAGQHARHRVDDEVLRLRGHQRHVGLDVVVGGDGDAVGREDRAGVDAEIDKMQRDAEMLRLAIGQREVAAIDAAIGRVDARMIIHDRAGARLQQRPAQHAGRGDEDGPRRSARMLREGVFAVEIVDVDAQVALTGVASHSARRAESVPRESGLVTFAASCAAFIE